MTVPGRLYGVSLGPGDPELMTRRAFALLQRPDALWTWPIRSGKSESYALAIAGRNRASFGVANHTLVHGKAPEHLDGWADPDAVFIGGSGGELAELIALCLRRLRSGGWLVMNFVTLENLATATAALKEANVVWDVLQLQAARSKPILHMNRMAAENPVWIVCAQKAQVGS